MKESTILVIGGTGKTGRRVVSELSQRGFEPRAAARSGPVRFDWDDRSTWERAAAGAHAAYAIDPVYMGDVPDPSAAESVAEFAAIARTTGVRQIVLLSARDVSRAGRPELLASEEAVKRSGLAWTILRPTWFMQNFSEMDLLRDPLLDNKLRLCAGNGGEPFIDLEDLAAVVVATLADEKHFGATYELSGPEALSFSDAVDAISTALGRDIQYEEVSSDAYQAELRAGGMSPESASLFATLISWIGEGRNTDLSDGVQRVLDREPSSFGTYLERAVAAGSWDRDAVERLSASEH